jgi:uncharacterized protein
MDTLPTAVVWSVEETAGFDSAWVTLNPPSLSAVGRAVGQRPEPYWLSYELETDDTGATTRLLVNAQTGGETRELDLRRDGDTWTTDREERPDLAGALDCDLASCPLTNTMPILRHELHRSPGEHQFLMAFVEVPSLRVRASLQTYTHLGTRDGLACVRYAAGTFTSDLVIDADGLVVRYPTMADRLAPGP